MKTLSAQISRAVIYLLLLGLTLTWISYFVFPKFFNDTEIIEYTHTVVVEKVDTIFTEPETIIKEVEKIKTIYKTDTLFAMPDSVLEQYQSYPYYKTTEFADIKVGILAKEQPLAVRFQVLPKPFEVEGETEVRIPMKTKLKYMGYGAGIMGVIVLTLKIAKIGE